MMKSISSLFLKTFVCAFVMLFNCAKASDLNNLLLMNVDIVDVENAELLKDQNILIGDGKILKISADPSGLREAAKHHLDLSGYTVTPGLFDMHVHNATSPSGYDSLDDVKKRLRFLLRHGVTGIRDMAGDVRQLAYLSRMALIDEIDSPNIYYSALMAGETFFDDPRTHASTAGLTAGQVPWMKAVSNTTDYALAVAQAIGTGASGIKLYADLTAEQAGEVISEARRQGIPSWGHAAILPAKPHELVDAGITSMSHASLLAWSSTDKGTGTGKERYSDFAIDTDASMFKQMISSMVEQSIYLDATINTFKDHKSKNVYQNGIAAAKAAYTAGVPFLVGTDSGVDYSQPYPPIVDEMMALHEEVGLTPIDVIKAATIHAAKLLKIEQSVGSLSEGKQADLVILNSNPLNDLNAFKSVVMTIKNGRIIQ
ncbi:amidohydrolase family protein [Alteromonas facilis]|uniref:amidohydrolase family protein n=1 Tax=Alteromonas facilis TaxID=2048004 RepID=UPI000C29211F|nr:amidohydrolase family protein [Alteromonas facilis]